MAFKRVGRSEEEQQEDLAPKRFKRLGQIEDPKLQQSRAGSILSAGTKGVVRGLNDLSNIYGGEDTASEILRELYGSSPEELSEMKSQRNQIGEQFLNETLPSKEGAIEGLTGRAGRMLPGILIGPGGIGSKAGSLGLGAAAGQIAEESGAGEWGQAASEILGSIFGGSVSRGLRPKPGSRQEQLINIGRRYGLSEIQIAPAIQSDRKIGLLAPTAHRGSGTVGKIDQSRAAIGKIFGQLEASPAAQRVFSPPERIKLLNDLTQELQNLPHSVRDLIYGDALDLLQSTPNSQNLMNFYRDVNYHIGRGHGQLGGIRKILQDHLTTHLGDDFAAANELYGNVRRLGIRVRPDLSSHFHDFRIASDISTAIVEKDKKGLGRAITELITRFTSSKLLTSPYMQHIPRKLLHSAQNGSFESAKKILTIMLNKDEEKEESNQKSSHK